jgi:DGQHR domain-containing protein
MPKKQLNEEDKIVHRYTFSNVTQGKYRFYSLTIPSDILARTCFVTTREEDPRLGFQRLLDPKRAGQIAEYIDSGLGTIPNSIVLSAQEEAELEIIRDGKILTFVETPRAFLILDGQHRVYGFSLAKSQLRIPVIIYNDLTRQEESRLFIDINTKQRPVPNELLLDIKKLADYETSTEQLMREIFDLFNTNTNSPLLGLLSPVAKSKNKISRVTFNAAIKPLIDIFQEREAEEIYETIRAYLEAFLIGVRSLGVDQHLTKPIVFRAIMQFFQDIAPRVKYKYNSDYSVDNFYEVLKPVFDVASSSWFSNSKTQSSLHGKLMGAMQSQFTL